MDPERKKVIIAYINNFIRNNPEVENIILSHTDQVIGKIVKKYVKEELGEELNRILCENKEQMIAKLNAINCCDRDSKFSLCA